MLSLGEIVDLEFVLRPAAATLETQLIRAASPAHAGAATTIDQRMLTSLPTLNRDFYDFVRLVPQVSTRVSLPNGGFSAGGVGFRFNNFLINGVSERSLAGSVSSSFSGVRSMSLDAVKEYEVLLAPYDVRYGDFAGALVNTVTKSGTNSLSGSVFAYGRNDRLGRRSASETNYDRAQYGFSMGGPIVRDRLHFFVAPEIQQLRSAAPGAFVGQPESSSPPVRLSVVDLARMTEIMRSYGLTAGSGGAVTNSSPLVNLFLRMDVAVPALNTRVVIWHNRGKGEDGTFSRASRDTFSLSSARVTRNAAARTSALQFHTTLRRAGGGHNELLVSRFSQSVRSVAPVRQPVVRVSVPGVTGGRITVNTGTHETAQGTAFGSHAISVKDNITVPLGMSHVLTVGAEVERFSVRRGGVLNSYGSWSFASLDDLEVGEADRYEVGLDLGVPNVPLRGWQRSAYVSDKWRARRDLSLTAGLRADLLSLDDRAPYHSGVDTVFHRRTDQPFGRKVELAPRLGFIWNPGNDPRHSIRGGTGLFTTRFPLAWAHSALAGYGAGTGFLRCGRSPRDLGPAPAFNPDRSTAPTTCANGAGIAVSRRGDVDLLSENLRMMRALRGSLAYDRSFGQGLRVGTELMATRGLSDFMFVNLNLGAPESLDRNGRVMYGSIGPSGTAEPALRSTFSEVIDLVNTSGSHSYQATVRAARVAGRITGAASYTYSRVRDAATPVRVNTSGIVAWGSARVVSGRHDHHDTGISSNDIPHRITAAGTFAIPRRWRTELSFYYVGESGRPFTYRASGTQGRGDLNADGTNANDPVYVPLDVKDETEIRFDGDAASVIEQQVTLEHLIQRTPCLRRQRGQILERNSCREPWSHTTAAAVRQTIPIRRRSIEVQADLFNVLNLLHRDWGTLREAAPALLEHVGQSSESGQSPQSIFRFDRSAPVWTTLATESAFQLQLALRYRF
jgi:hypothetical protein